MMIGAKIGSKSAASFRCSVSADRTLSYLTIVYKRGADISPQYIDTNMELVSIKRAI